MKPLPADIAGGSGLDELCGSTENFTNVLHFAKNTGVNELRFELKSQIYAFSLIQ
jgi:hypothetical protein